MSESSDSQGNGEEQDKKQGKKRGKGQEKRGRIFAFLEYEDSTRPDSVERAKALHVRGFVSPWHDADVRADGSLKKRHRHWILFFDGKKSRAQLDEIRAAIMGENFNPKLEDIACAGAYVRYLIHLDDPDKAQYRREDVISLGGADFEIASAMPGDDASVMGAISAYVVAADITSVNSLIRVCRDEGRRDWLDYISRRGYVIGMMIGHNIKRLERIRMGYVLPGDTMNAGESAIAGETSK